MSLIERLTALFAPDDCLGCGREGALLCVACRPELPPLVGRCFGCHRRLNNGAGCPSCIAEAGLNRLYVAADYRDTAKLLVASLKFRGNQAAARTMAQIMADVEVLKEESLLVNMPATTAHIRERGFDQAVLIARQLATQTGLPFRNALRRTGQHHQLGAGRKQRLQQLDASLRVSRTELVKGQHVVLVDDVLTTGSSLSAAARGLRASGAKTVSGLVFAQSIK